MERKNPVALGMVLLLFFFFTVWFSELILLNGSVSCDYFTNSQK